MIFLNLVFVYVLVWWIVIFTVLPWGNNPAEKIESGHASGAPANPRMRQKLIATSVISLIVTAAIFAIIHYTDFSFHDSVKNWELE